MASISGAGTLSEIEMRLHAPTSLMSSRIIPVCLPIMQAFSHLLFHFCVDDSPDRAVKLRTADTDFAIISREELTADMNYKALQPEQYVLVAPAAWKGRRLQEIIQQERIVDYNAEDQVTYQYLKEYHLFDHANHRRYFVNQTDHLALLVAEGVGYTTLTKEFAEPYVKSGRLIMLNKARAYHCHPLLAWYNRPAPPPYFQAIIQAIR